MAYVQKRPVNLVARSSYGGLSGITDFLSNLFSGYNAAEQAQGASNQAILAAQAQQASTTSTIMLLGGVGLVAVLLLRRKKKPATT